MGILDRAAERLGYMRQDAVAEPASPPAPAPPSPAPTPRQTAQRRADDYAGVLGAYAGRMAYGGPSTSLLAGEELYGSDGLASLIVDRPAEDAVARGFKIDGDEKEDVLNEMDRLDAGPALTDALRAARLHGAAAIMPLMDDGLPLDAPLDEGRIEQISQLMVYPATALSMRAERYTDPTLANYGLPTAYDVRPRYGLAFVVHESRLLKVSGDPLSFSASQNARLPWLGRAVLDGCYGDFCRYRDALRLAKLILERKQQPVHAMSGLGEMLSAGLDDVVAKRLDAADLARGILTTVAVDADDRFTVVDTSLSGIDSVLKEYKTALAASSGLPVPILFGELNRTLASTGDGELENYHQRLRQLQERSLRPAMEHLAGLIWAQRSLSSREPNHWRLVFEPLWSPSEKETAEVGKLKAEADKFAVETMVAMTRGGLATPQEARDLLRESVFETLPNEALPEEDDDTPQGEEESARKSGVDAIVALLDGGIVDPDEARTMARRIFPDLPQGSAPEPEPLPMALDPMGQDPAADTPAPGSQPSSAEPNGAETEKGRTAE